MCRLWWTCAEQTNSSCLGEIPFASFYRKQGTPDNLFSITMAMRAWTCVLGFINLAGGSKTQASNANPRDS